MNNNTIFSIIIIFKQESESLKKLLNELNFQKNKNFEVLLVSENSYENNIVTSYNIRFIKTDETYPGKKRHTGYLESKGSVLCFIDDDAYPEHDWLKNINDYIKKGFKVLGGPAIDITDEKFIPKILSLFYKLKILGGFPERYSKQKNKIVDDWPSVNFVIDKYTYSKTKGFDYKIWPGEDTLLCNELNLQGKNINYFNDILVHHKRRINISSHIKQLYGYSSTRGLLFRKKIKNSYKLKFLIPSLFLFYVLSLGLIDIPLYSAPLIIYFLLNFSVHLEFKFRKREKFIICLFSFFITFINHLIYGLGFIIGIFSNRKL